MEDVDFNLNGVICFSLTSSINSHHLRVLFNYLIYQDCLIIQIVLNIQGLKHLIIIKRWYKSVDVLDNYQKTMIFVFYR